MPNSEIFEAFRNKFVKIMKWMSFDCHETCPVSILSLWLGSKGARNKSQFHKPQPKQLMVWVGLEFRDSPMSLHSSKLDRWSPWIHHEALTNITYGIRITFSHLAQFLSWFTIMDVEIRFLPLKSWQFCPSSDKPHPATRQVVYSPSFLKPRYTGKQKIIILLHQGV